MAKRAVVWTHTARDDLESIIGYIVEDDPQAALQILEKIEHRALSLAEQPERGRIVLELRDVGALHYRELIDRPWRIVYRIDARHVYVTAVLDSRRDLQELLLERLIRS